MSDEMADGQSALSSLKSQGGAAVEAHAHSANHRDEIEASTIIGCFYCCKTSAPSLIEQWIDDDTTAMCPKCGIDSVIGDASGYPAGDREFLQQMKAFWF